MRGSESLDMTKELRMPRAPYENVSARPAQLNSVECPKGNGFTYGSNNHTIQWMPEQPNRLKGVNGEKCFFRRRSLVQAQWRSGRRRSHIWARCMSPTQGMKPEWKGRCGRNDVFKELENERRRFCWKPLPPNKWQVGVHKGNLLLWASRCDTWEIEDW